MMAVLVVVVSFCGGSSGGGNMYEYPKCTQNLIDNFFLNGGVATRGPLKIVVKYVVTTAHPRICSKN